MALLNSPGLPGTDTRPGDWGLGHHDDDDNDDAVITLDRDLDPLPELLFATVKVASDTREADRHSAKWSFTTPSLG